MACVDLTGSNWLRGVLVPRETVTVLMDPPIRFFCTDGKLTVRIVGTMEEDYPVTCNENGATRELNFRREATINGETVITEYAGTAVPYPNRANFGIVRGTFSRTTIAADGSKTLLAGDWETEKPT